MSALEQFFSEDHLRAIAAMLFHSIWQGAILAVAAAIIILLTKRSAPALRYTFLFSLLLAFTTAAFYTYLVHLNDVSYIAAIDILTAGSHEDKRAGGLLSGLSYDRVIAVFHANAPLIVFCWLSLLFLRLCIITVGYYSARRLTRTALIAPPEYWKERWINLLQQMQLVPTVTLMQSALAKVPMVIGHFKPVVLVPAGMLMSLSPSEMEAILLHELAHIKRRDYLLNLVQQGVQSIFFFHPAVSWVCSLINAEREHCCDDIAASHNGESRTYINALVSFYEQSLPPSTALSFGGRKPQSIGDRIRRLINHRNKTLNNMEKVFLTAALVLTGFFVYAFYHDGTIKNQPRMELAATDSIPGGVTEIRSTKDGKKVVVIFKGEEISELIVDGKKIPREKYGEYQSMLDEIREEQQQAAHDAGQAKEDAEEAIRDADEAREQAREDAARAKKDRQRNRNNNDDEEENEIDQEHLDKVIADAMKEVGKVLSKVQVELSDGKLREEVRNGLREAQEGLKEARRELREQQNSKGRNYNNDENFDEDIVEVAEEAVQLALEAAQFGLREANIEIKEELEAQEHSGKMDRREYRERKKELREQYRNSQRENK